MTRFVTFLIVPILVMSGIVAPMQALADVHCSVPMTQWQPRAAVSKMAADRGWTVRRIRIDDGCYLLIGTDAKGQKIAVKINPGTLAIVQIGGEDDEGHRTRHHMDDDD